MKIVPEVKMICIEGKQLAFYINGRRIVSYIVDEKIDKDDLMHYYNKRELWI